MISGPRFAVPLLLAASSWHRTRRPPRGRGEPGNPTVNIAVTRCARLRRAGNRHGAVTWTIPAACIGKGPGRRRPMI